MTHDSTSVQVRGAHAWPKTEALPRVRAGRHLGLLDGFHLISVHSSPQTTLPPDSVIPTVMISCSNCGLVQYHNVHTLGVSEVLGIPAAGEAF